MLRELVHQREPEVIQSVVAQCERHHGRPIRSAQGRAIKIGPG